MAFAQLGIQNNYSNNLSLRDCQGSSDTPKAGRPSKPESRGHLEGSREADLALPDWQNPMSEAPQGLSIYTFYRGGAAPGCILCMHEPWITQACGPAFMA